MRRHVMILTALVLADAAWGAAALGCPVCYSDTGRQVRAGIVDQDFAWNLVATLLPFPLLIGIVALLHFGVPGWGRSVRARRPVEPTGTSHGS